MIAAPSLVDPVSWTFTGDPTDPLTVAGAVNVTVGAGLIVNAVCFVSVAPVEEVAVHVVVYDPAVVGVPVTAPVVEFNDSPGGRPVEEYVTVAESFVDDDRLNDVNVVFTRPVAVAGAVNVTVGAGLIVNDVDLVSVGPEELVAVYVAVYDPTVVGVPVTAPVLVFSDRPGGRPVTEYVTVPPSLVDADTPAPEIAVPTRPVTDAGAVRVTVGAAEIVHAVVLESVGPAELVAVKVVVGVPTVVGVPDTAPVVEFREIPGGRLLAEYVTVPPPVTDDVNVNPVIGTDTRPVAVAGAVKVTDAPDPIVNVVVFEFVAPVAPAAVNVVVYVPAVVGVPVIAPVVAF